MTQRWIVDAMNVIGSRPDGWWKDRRAAMARLVELVESWSATQTASVTVVFERPLSPPIESAVIGIAHAPKAATNSADDEIVRLVKADPNPAHITVVTSDGTLVERIRHEGASAYPAAAFRSLIEPVGDRRPTSHERMSGKPWDASYRDGPAPWDLERPQPAVVRLASRGAFAGRVLDAGCGAGDNALHIASLGLPVLGFDVAQRAVAMAREKAAEQGLDVEFLVADALRLDGLGRTFDTVLDCGLFHTFDAGERTRYLTSLESVTAVGSTMYVLCFSDEGAETGPHPVRRAELESTFDARSSWKVVAIECERLETRFHDTGASAWCATVSRV
jgi:SAM-dependent methyltransferase